VSFVYCPLYCLSFYPLSIAHCIVCPFILCLLPMVLSVLLSFVYCPLYCLCFVYCPLFCLFFAIRIKGQTIQLAIDKG
jgi:hypothetical protein